MNGTRNATGFVSCAGQSLHVQRSQGEIFGIIKIPGNCVGIPEFLIYIFLIINLG